MSVTFEHHQRKEKVGVALIEIKTNFKRDEYINKTHRIVLSTLPFNILILPMEVGGGGGSPKKGWPEMLKGWVPLKLLPELKFFIVPLPPKLHSSQLLNCTTELFIGGYG